MQFASAHALLRRGPFNATTGALSVLSIIPPPEQNFFTPNASGYRFVYPNEHDTTAEALAACEAAWAFYGGIFRVMIVDNKTS